MTPYVIAAKGLNRQAPGSRHLPSRRLLAPNGPLAGGVSSAGIGPAEAFGPRYAVTLSVNVQLCYRLRCLRGVIWEILDYRLAASAALGLRDLR